MVKLRLVVIGLAASVALSGCTHAPALSPGPIDSGPFYLLIPDMAGPRSLSVEINGHIVSSTVCDALKTQAVDPTILPSASMPLPWTVRLLRPNGTSLGIWAFGAGSGPQILEIQGDAVVNLPVGGPPGSPYIPGPTCAP